MTNVNQTTETSLISEILDSAAFSNRWREKLPEYSDARHGGLWRSDVRGHALSRRLPDPRCIWRYPSAPAGSYICARSIFHSRWRFLRH
jgi:hypothetical protein